MKLVFVHHSTGEAWLADAHGGLGIALRNNNYFVSDTNYGWGPDAIGDTTDIGHWWTWFRGPSSPTYLAALYAESGRHSRGYSRLDKDPGGPNEIIMFKSCYPNSKLSMPESPVPAIADNPLKGRAVGSSAYTVANAKGIYLDLLPYFGAHPEKLFVAVVAPPVASPDTPGGRALADWLVDHWLQDSGYTVGNVLVFDFYNVLSSKTGGSASDVGLATGNHHRVWNGAVQHKTDEGANRLAYPSATGGSHPNAAGDQKATAEFVPLLNAAYNAWKGEPSPPPVTTATGYDDAWHRSAVTVSFSAVPAVGGLPVAYTEYRLDGDDWKRGNSVVVTAPADHSGDGRHTVSYRSADIGVPPSIEDARTCTVRIDTTGPSTRALGKATVKTGTAVTVRYRVDDALPSGVALSPTATVQIVVRSASQRVVKRLRLGEQATNVPLSTRWNCTLRRGNYRFFIYATDEAGNAQEKVGVGRLTVR